MDCLAGFLWNVGKLANPTRAERFAFKNCIGRKLIVWNEARIDPAYFTDVLALLVGETFSANIKMKSPENFNKSPVIIMSNNDVLPNKENFKKRYKKVNWREFKELKKYRPKKPNPLCFGIIFDYVNKYNI